MAFIRANCLFGQWAHNVILSRKHPGAFEEIFRQSAFVRKLGPNPEHLLISRLLTFRESVGIVGASEFIPYSKGTIPDGTINGIPVEIKFHSCFKCEITDEKIIKQLYGHCRGKNVDYCHLIIFNPHNIKNSSYNYHTFDLRSEKVSKYQEIRF